MRAVVGITGASGVVYGLRLLKQLRRLRYETHLVVSENAKQLISHETKHTWDDVKALADFCYENNAFTSRLASGSFGFDAMVIAPCTMSTAAKIAAGIADNLIARTATVCLKEQRKLVIVPRETPMSTIHLRNLAELSACGAVILPASPGFYHRPADIDGLVNFIVGKILDVLGLEHELYRRWGAEE